MWANWLWSFAEPESITKEGFIVYQGMLSKYLGINWNTDAKLRFGLQQQPIAFCTLPYVCVFPVFKGLSCFQRSFLSPLHSFLKTPVLWHRTSIAIPLYSLEFHWQYIQIGICESLSNIMHNATKNTKFYL